MTGVGSGDDASQQQGASSETGSGGGTDNADVCARPGQQDWRGGAGDGLGAPASRRAERIGQISTAPDRLPEEQTSDNAVPRIGSATATNVSKNATNRGNHCISVAEYPACRQGCPKFLGPRICEPIPAPEIRLSTPKERRKLPRNRHKEQAFVRSGTIFRARPSASQPTRDGRLVRHRSAPST